LSSANTGIRLIVGLGNPGPTYTNTRHNVGAWLVNHIAAKNNICLNQNKKLKGCVGKLSHDADNTFLFIPDTYMNESGQAILAIAQFYQIAPENILVAHDELDFPAGKIRIKFGGGHGGHNGLRDTINKLSSKDFYRIRIGINHPGNRNQVSNYVLSKPNNADTNAILDAIEATNNVIDLLTSGQFEQAFLQLHSENK
jgi:peptidyl-tRNA hydrolase, PTH1 family